jgi:glycosyltransferase involved in cell wall biosynthesis
MLNTLQRYITAYRNKVTNKLFGVASVKHTGKKKGDVLFSYLTQPLTLSPNESLSDPHSNNWVVPKISQLFSERGYDVDVINWWDASFIPKKKYAVCIDIHNNLERFVSLLPSSCIKIQYINGSHWRFQNEAEEKRMMALESRRNVRFPMKRNVPPSDFEKYADFVIGYGNKTVHETFPMPNGKKIIPLPVPTMEEYDFPEGKDFSRARKHFLWFGGGGAILKGLDLILEAFAELPDLQLTLIGPIFSEKEFCKIYEKELKLSNITVYKNPYKEKDDAMSKIGGKYVYDVIKECGAVLGMSASEGGGGATVQAMQAGVFPIVTPNTGINESIPSIVLENPTVENIKETVKMFSNIPPEKLEKLSREVWSFTKAHHTKQAFTKEWGNFIDNIVKLP